MSSRDSTSPEVVEQIRATLESEGPATYSELMTRVSADDIEIRRAVSKLWKDGVVYHTVDRKLDLKDGEKH